MLYLTGYDKGEKMTRLIRAVMAFLGLFMLVPGVVKFFDPFKTFFTTQIAMSELSFPTLSYWMGQLGEISIGLLLFSLVFFWNKFTSAFLQRGFYFSHIIVTIIMLVSLYVHAHPAGPVEVLPMEEKFPFLSIVLLLGVVANMVLIRKVSLKEVR